MMEKGRLEAFTDGVIAIVITIMVLDMKVPTGSGFAALMSGLPIFLAYALSYANVGIFWNNHHHMLHATERIDGKVLWANLLLLFWISLVHGAANRGLRRGTGDGVDRLSVAGVDDNRMQRFEFAAGHRGGRRFEGQTVAADLPRCDPAGLCPALDRDLAIYLDRADVVRPRPAN